MGDVNAHLQSKTFIKPNDVRGNYLNDMLDYHNLLAVNTLPICTGTTASFVSYGDAHRSLIGNILIPDVKLDSVIHCEITDDNVLNVSRHRTVSCILSLADMDFQTLSGSNKSHIKWKNLNEITLQMYSTKLDIALRNIDCSDIADIHQRIDQKHKNIVSCIQNITDNVLPKTKFRSFLKPYWDQKLRDLDAVMRQRRRSWIVAGKPRGDNHVSYREYKYAKCQFRPQHRKCAEKYLNDLNKDIDEAVELDSVFFWKKKIAKNVKDLLQAQVLKWNFQKVMSAEIHSKLLQGGGVLSTTLCGYRERSLRRRIQNPGRFTSRRYIG